jgi:hypothetical protein
MTFFVLGLTLTSAQGATWSVAPIPSGLDATEGGFETGLGWFGVKWSNKQGVFTLTLEAPPGTRGTVTLPGTGSIQVDGKAASTSGAGFSVHVLGGQHTFIQNM